METNCWMPEEVYNDWLIDRNFVFDGDDGQFLLYFIDIYPTDSYHYSPGLACGKGFGEYCTGHGKSQYSEDERVYGIDYNFLEYECFVRRLGNGCWFN